MKLSILICTTFDRSEMFNFLKHHLQNQINELGKQREVEILSECDNKEISVGKKRQNLLEKAKGDYVVFIDSDDWCPYSYVENILKATNHNPDCIGFLINCTGTPGITASASNRWNGWGDKVGGFDYVRTIYHKNPVKRDIALQIGYKDMRFGEDYDYSLRLKQSGLLQSEEFINEVMYEYRYKYEDPKTKYGL